MWARIKSYGELIRFHKPIGTLLLMWPMLMALWVAGNGHPSFKNLFIFMAGCFLMRSAGCAINDFADRKIDKQVRRTEHRPLARGALYPIEAIFVFLVCVLLAFLLVLQTNTLTLMWSCLAFLLAFIYPFMKRVTYYPQFFLGAAFACAIPMSFAAEVNQVPFFSGFLYIATLLWAMAYDTQYAMVDREDDLKAHVKSTALVWGKRDRVGILLCYLSMIGALLAFGYGASLRWPYYGSLILVFLFIFYQHQLIYTRSPEVCFKAFLNNNRIGMMLFLGVVLSYILP